MLLLDDIRNVAIFVIYFALIGNATIGNERPVITITNYATTLR